MKKKNVKSFSTRWGFILASVGSAVGMANVWGFPNKMGSNGGGAFLLIYILFVLIFSYVGLPAEFAMGRRAATGTLGAYENAWATRGKGAGKTGAVLGWLPLAGSLCIAIGYAVIVTYVLKALVDSVAGTLMTADAAAWFSDFSSRDFSVIPYHIIVVAGTLLTLFLGAHSIEKSNKVMMPLFFIIFLVLAVRVALLPGSAEGYKFMFVPDFSVFDSLKSFFDVLKSAAGQMFFSLSLGMGAMITYGSYLSKSEDLNTNTIIIPVADTIVAIMAGMAVMPACSAFGMDYGQGPGLLFNTLQTVFMDGMGGFIGNLMGFLFYTLVFIAAITSSISLLEVNTAYIIDKKLEKGKKVNRKSITVIMAAVIFIVGLPTALDGLGTNVAGGALIDNPAITFGLPTVGATADWLDFYDMIAEGILMPLGSLAMSIIIGWVFGNRMVKEEVACSGHVYRAEGFYNICFKYIVPVIMVIVLYAQIQTFFG